MACEGAVLCYVAQNSEPFSYSKNLIARLRRGKKGEGVTKPSQCQLINRMGPLRKQEGEGGEGVKG